MYSLECVLFISFLLIPGCTCLNIQINGLTSPVGSKQNPGKSCKDIKDHGGTVTKNYYITIGGSVVEAYCDQTTAGGGWTLVYSYTFTDPDHFNHGSNAVTPRPNWPVKGDVPTSTTTPTSEIDYNAMPYNQWKTLGSEFLIKSNINNWVSCTDGSGSLAGWRSGSIKCKIVKNVTGKCMHIVPDRIQVNFYGCAVDIYAYKAPSPTVQCYYSLETSLGPETWPTHDPCGEFTVSDLCNVAVPRGNIYVR